MRKSRGHTIDSHVVYVRQAYVELSEYLFSFGCYKTAAYYFEMAFKIRRDYIYDELNAKICIMVQFNSRL